MTNHTNSSEKRKPQGHDEPFTKFPNWLFGAPCVSDEAKILWCLIRHKSFGTDIVTRPVEYLAEISGKSRRTVQRHLDELRKARLIKTTRKRYNLEIRLLPFRESPRSEHSGHAVTTDMNTDSSQVNTNVDTNMDTGVNTAEMPDLSCDRNGTSDVTEMAHLRDRNGTSESQLAATGVAQTGTERLSLKDSFLKNSSTPHTPQRGAGGGLSTNNGNGRRKRQQREPDPRIEHLLNFWREQYAEYRDEPAHIQPKRDRNRIKRLLNTYDRVEEVERRMVAYLEDDHEWMYEQPLWSLRFFENEVERY